METKNKIEKCPACGIEVENPPSNFYKCEDCLYWEAKIFFWVVGGMTIVLLLATLIRYLKG